jgi:NAD(P)-dependent dehydrogenase (short-subunit alcohol dehydrogenase family)
MSFDLDLAGRRALVTGGTKGVGAAVVKALAEAGTKVVTTARSVPDGSPEGVHYIAADITSATGCAAVAKEVLAHLGGIDIIVNVLGGSTAPGGGFAVLDDEKWSKELNLNLMPAVRLDRALLPSMITQGSGVIVHVTSIQHMLPLPEFHDGLCCRQGCALDLQQEPVEGGDAKGDSRGASLAGLGGNRGGRRACRAPRQAGRHGL